MTVCRCMFNQPAPKDGQTKREWKSKTGRGERSWQTVYLCASLPESVDIARVLPSGIVNRMHGFEGPK